MKTSDYKIALQEVANRYAEIEPLTKRRAEIYKEYTELGDKITKLNSEAFRLWQHTMENALIDMDNDE